MERWTDQSTWNEALLNQKIVISTEAVLLDALGHAFVKMSRIALLIFDEGKNMFRLSIFSTTARLKDSIFTPSVALILKLTST